MKSFHIRALALALGFIGALSAPSSIAEESADTKGNLLVNGSFEKGTEGWTIKAFEPGGGASVDKSELRDGRPTLKIENPKGNDTFVNQKVIVKPNTRYRITGYIKTKDILPDNRKSKDGASLSIAGGFECTSPIQKTKPWAKVSLEFESGGKNEVVVGPRIGQYHSTISGTAWFADISLVEIGRARR